MEGGNTAVTEKSEFEILVIKPNNISNLDFNNVNYITDILNNKCFESIKTNSEDIANIFASKLNPNNIENTIAVTNICYETYDKLYEICFLDIPEEEKNNDNYNNIASILDISKDTIFGNAILLKTNLPIDNNGMKLISSYKKDIRNILDARINHYPGRENKDEFKKYILNIFKKALYIFDYSYKNTNFLREYGLIHTQFR